MIPERIIFVSRGNTVLLCPSKTQIFLKPVRVRHHHSGINKISYSILSQTRRIWISLKFLEHFRVKRLFEREISWTEKKQEFCVLQCYVGFREKNFEGFYFAQWFKYYWSTIFKKMCFCYESWSMLNKPLFLNIFIIKLISSNLL